MAENSLNDTWNKHGVIYVTPGQVSWSRTHTQLPTVDYSSPESWRIYYSTRDEQNHAVISFIDVDPADPRNIRYIHDRPVLATGELGAFDDTGVHPTAIVALPDRLRMYYIGWTTRQTVPYSMALGLAESYDRGETYVRIGTGPILGPNLHEPYVTSSAFVRQTLNTWQIWYTSGTGWYLIDGRAEPRYHIKYAESPDGISWERKGTVAIDFSSCNEGGLARPTIIESKGVYRMWYSRRGLHGYRGLGASSYRVGYAESMDGQIWVRKDDTAAIDVSTVGWDSEMIAYPHVFKYGNKYYMFYNGNGFGRSGIGYATAEVSAIER